MILRLKRSEVPSEAQQWQVVESSIPKRTYTQRVVQHSEEDSQVPYNILTLQVYPQIIYAIFKTKKKF